MDIERITEKYGDRRISLDTLISAARTGNTAQKASANAMQQAVTALIEAEDSLRYFAKSIFISTTKAINCVDAHPGHKTASLNPLGELQGNATRFDALVALRAERIAHLRTVIQLFDALDRDPTPFEPPPSTPATPAQHLKKATQ